MAVSAAVPAIGCIIRTPQFKLLIRDARSAGCSPGLHHPQKSSLSQRTRNMLLAQPSGDVPAVSELRSRKGPNPRYRCPSSGPQARAGGKLAPASVAQPVRVLRSSRRTGSPRPRWSTAYLLSSPAVASASPRTRSPGACLPEYLDLTDRVESRACPSASGQATPDRSPRSAVSPERGSCCIRRSRRPGCSGWSGCFAGLFCAPRPAV